MCHNNPPCHILWHNIKYRLAAARRGSYGLLRSAPARRGRRGTKPWALARYMNQQPISDYSGSPFCTTTLHNHANRIIKQALLGLSILHNKRIIKQASLSQWVAEYNLKVSSA